MNAPSSLGETFTAAAQSRKDAEWIAQLGRIVDHAIGLFRLGPAVVYVDKLIDLNVRTFTIEVEGLKNYPFHHRVDQYALSQAYFPALYVFESMRVPLFNHFRYRPCLPVEDHIILGED